MDGCVKWANDGSGNCWEWGASYRGIAPEVNRTGVAYSLPVCTDEAVLTPNMLEFLDSLATNVTANSTHAAVDCIEIVESERTDLGEASDTAVVVDGRITEPGLLVARAHTAPVDEDM